MVTRRHLTCEYLFDLSDNVDSLLKLHLDVYTALFLPDLETSGPTSSSLNRELRSRFRHLWPQPHVVLPLDGE